MSNDVNSTMAQGMSCARKCLANKELGNLQLFAPAGHLNFTGIIILGLLTEAKDGNEYIVVTTDRYSKPNKVLTTTKTTATRTANIFMEHWVANFRISLTVLTDNFPYSLQTSLPHSTGS